MSSKFPSAIIPIYEGDDQQRMAELRADAEHARNVVAQNAGAPKRLGDVGPEAEADEAKQRFDDFVDEAAERAEPLHVRAIGRRRFRDLRTEYPARKVTRTVDGEEVEGVHEDDEGFGVNTETFPMALLTYRDADEPDVRTVITPERPTAKALEKWLEDDITEGVFDQAWTTAYYLNTTGASDPKAAKYSAAHQRSAETSA